MGEGLMDSAGIALVFSSVSLTISYLTYKSNRYKLYVGKKINFGSSSYSILFWVTNCGKRPVTVKGFYASAVNRQTGFEEDICTDFSDDHGFVSLDIRLEEADIKEMNVWEAAWLGDEQSLSLSDIKVTVIDACGNRYEAKDLSGTWKQRFRRSRSVRWLTSQLRSLLRINKG